jgi:hypothetical protein
MGRSQTKGEEHMSIEVMKQALEALEYDNPSGRSATINKLRQAIAEAEKQEPVVFHVHKSAIEENDFKEHVNFYVGPAPSEDFVTLYTAPQKREWVSLTDEEVNVIIDKEIGFNSCWGPEEKFARAIEAKLKEKNSG